jgi:primosomal protein N' (replication factor Y) (superfamily II helicase)
MSSANLIAKVLLPVPLDTPLDYRIPGDQHICENDYVVVPFGKKTLVGVVYAIEDHSDLPAHKVKPVDKVLDMFPPFSAQMRAYIDWVAQYTLSPRGNVLKMVLSVSEAFTKPLKDKDAAHVPSEPIVLSQEQQDSAKVLSEAVAASIFQPIVLEGVTGSGKTEVYFEAIHRALGQGKQTLVLLPEIALSTQWLERFHKRFGYAPTVWHSDLTPKQRRENWQRIALGLSPVVVGARSALFLPYKNLGCIIVDEEHDHSYKQESGVLYQARDMAVVRAKLEEIPIILSSATPSLETIYNIQQKRYKHLLLSHRYKGASLPTVDIIDMRQHVPWISAPLQEKITETLARGEQTLLFLNRRGYAPLILCTGCGHRVSCVSCSSWLVYHKKSNQMMCHHCGYHIPKPNICPSCQAADHLITWGPGVERIAEQAAQLFPDAKVAVVTSDTIQSHKKAQEVLQDIQDRKVDIVVGTQLMAKGHHFPYLTLVGVIDADMGNTSNDIRGGERTYQILQQVGGRAGRAQQPGHVMLQTYMPTHPIMEAFKNYDIQSFLEYELKVRERLALPPYGRLAAIILNGQKPEAVEKLAHDLARHIPKDLQIEVLGPAPAPLHVKAGRYRWRFLVKGPKHVMLQPYILKWLACIQTPSSLQVQVDIDPYGFL